MKKIVPTKANTASEKEKCTHRKSGSCCYKKDGQSVCVDRMSCASCVEVNGLWSTATCNKRRNDLESSCCKNCFKLPKSINPEITGRTKKFRTRVTGQKVLPEDNETDTSRCQINYEEDIKICNSCIDINKICKKSCDRVTDFIKLLCSDSKQLKDKSSQVNVSETLQRYYTCLAKSKDEHAHALRGALKTYGCICKNEINITETELYQEFERINSQYFSQQGDCKKLLPDVFTDPVEEGEKGLGCCCQYVKEGDSEDEYDENNLIRCSCLNYHECVSNRAFYNVCWSADCEQCDKETEGDRSITTGCSGRDNPNNCSCCEDSYTNTKCFALKNEEPEVDDRCWIRLLNDFKDSCWVQVPSVCNTCQESWLGVSVRDGRVLMKDDITNIPRKECIDGGSCQQKVLKESEYISCGGDCTCGKQRARLSEDDVCKRITVEISAACPDAKKLSKKRVKQDQIILPLVSNCCECGRSATQQTSSVSRSVTSSTPSVGGGGYSPSSSSAPAPSPQQGSATSGPYGY